MSNEIDDDELESTAQRLGQLIGGLPEYEELMEAEKAINNDDETREKFLEVRELENKTRVAHEEGHDEKFEEFRESLIEAEEELNNMDLMEDYNEAAEELSEVLQEINSIISDEVEVNFADFA